MPTQPASQVNVGAGQTPLTNVPERRPGMSDYETLQNRTTTSASSTRTFVASIIVVKLPWWKRLWRRVKR